MKIDSSTERNHSTNKDCTTVRVLFWHNEYIKRHLYATDIKLCEKILTISCTLWNKAKKHFHHEDMFLGIREIIQMGLHFRCNNTTSNMYYIYSLLQNNLIIGYIKQQMHYNSILTFFNEEDLFDLDFLCSISLKYAYFASDLLCVTDMSDVINKLNNNCGVADFQMHKNILKIQDDLACDLQPDLCLGKELKSEAITVEYLNKILLRRIYVHSLVGRTDIKSSDENKVIAQNQFYEGINFIRESSCLKRAYGLWCYDRSVILPTMSDMNIFCDYKEFPEKYPGGNTVFHSQLSAPKYSIRKLLQALKEKHPHFKMPAVTDTPNDAKRRCKMNQTMSLTNTGKHARSLACDCDCYTTCEAYIRSATKNARECVKHGKIIAISEA